ncbi:MAG TPA: nitroreductase [Steroidobacteraceae bacterium]
MSDLSALLRRRSIPAQYLIEPGPNPAQVESAIDAALRAPDHGRLQPWRFRIVRGAARAQFAEQLVQATLARDPATPESQLQKLRARAVVPLTIVVSAMLKEHPKVPLVEQLLSAGAGIMNLLNAFDAQGFGAILLTGPNAYDPAVARLLGLEPGEQLLGFVYAGSVAGGTPTPAPRPERAPFVKEWLGGAPS